MYFFIWIVGPPYNKETNKTKTNLLEPHDSIWGLFMVCSIWNREKIVRFTANCQNNLFTNCIYNPLILQRWDFLDNKIRYSHKHVIIKIIYLFAKFFAVIKFILEGISSFWYHFWLLSVQNKHVWQSFQTSTVSSYLSQSF